MNGQFTGKDRVSAACRDQRTDRVPINVLVPMANELAGYTEEECVLEPEKALEAQVRAYEMFPSDMMMVPGDPFLPTTSATLMRLRYGPDARPKHPLEEKSALSGMEVRDPRKSKLYAKYLEMCRKTMDTFPDTWVSALFAAPWSMVANGFRGVENLIFDTVDDPEFVHEMMAVAVKFTKARGDALLETGVNLMMAETSASCSLISPKIYTQFVHPYLVEVIDYFKAQNANIDLHICGATDPILDLTTSLNVDIIDIDGPTSLSKTVALSGKKITARGNLAAELFRDGTPELIEAAVIDCLKTAGDGGKYILSPGCTIPEHTPMENIQAFWDAGLKYGTYQ
jgi:uroporphyrinogen decarboxylase